MVLYQYDFAKDEEKFVLDHNGHEIYKKEPKEMRFFNRFSKEFGHHDHVFQKEGDHHTDHVCSHSFHELMD